MVSGKNWANIWHEVEAAAKGAGELHSLLFFNIAMTRKNCHQFSLRFQITVAVQLSWGCLWLQEYIVKLGAVVCNWNRVIFLSPRDPVNHPISTTTHHDSPAVGA